jgi:hypothetical protein
MSSLFSRLPPTITAALLCLLLALPVFADPASLSFVDCFSGNASAKLAVSDVYGQVLDSAELGRYLNLTVIGTSPQDIFGFTNLSSSLGERRPILLLWQN